MTCYRCGQDFDGRSCGCADGITVIHSDCREILPLIEPAFVDLVLTDPPYGISVVQRNNRARNGDVRPGHVPGTWKSWALVAGDDEAFNPSPLLVFPRLVLFGANNYADQLPPSQSWIVWDRLNGATPADNADAELIWTNLGGTVRTYRQCWRGVAREDDGLEPTRHIHPTQKPVKVMLWLLERYTKPGDLVLDPYMGSGPIAKACQMTRRRYIGIEVEEIYVQRAIKRLEQSVLPLGDAA